MFAAHRATAMVAVVVLAGCGGDSEPAPSPAPTTDPAVTAPPALSPEEQAEVEIKATFEELIADMDQFYASAGDYSVEEVANDSPVVPWPVLGAAELELSNWTSSWRLGEVETVGFSSVTSHEVSVAEASGPRTATSSACRDLTAIEFRSYSGAPATLPYEPNVYQVWEMTWTYEPEAAPEAGIDAPGWYLDSFRLTTEGPC